MKIKKTVFIVAIVAFLTLLGAFLYPKVFVKGMVLPQVIDLKTIKLTDKPTFNFEIKNEGKNTIEVARIYTSCGCTTVLEPTGSFEINTNNSKVVTIQFDPSTMHKSGDDVYHEIYVLTTKPSEKEYLVKMKGKIL